MNKHLPPNLRRLLTYGLALGVGATVLQWLDFRHSMRSMSTEIFVVIIALIFSGLGIWFGLKLTRRATPVAEGGEPLDAEGACVRLGISARQYEVLQLLAEGHTNDEIGRRLHVSPNTVKTHLSQLYSKLNVSRRTKAVQRARELGLIA